MIGREPERERLGQLLAGLTAGSASFAEVTGDPGIGKTSLLADLGTRAQASGRLALSGRAAEFGQEQPFGVMIDALDGYLAGLPAGFLARLRAGGTRVDLLAPVFPALGALTDPAAGPGLVSGERYQLYRAVRELLTALATPQGLVLLLDDLHWSSEPTTEMIAYLVRHPPRAPVLVVLAYRPRQASVQLVRALAADRYGTAISRILLGPLSRRNADLLLGESIGPARRSALYDASGGNPFYLLALARLDHGQRGSPLGDAPADVAELPAQVQQAVLAEFAALSAPARLALQAAAVAGDPFLPERVAEIARLTERDVLRAIDEAVAHDLARPGDTPRRFGFRHPLVRHVVYQSIGPGWRLAAHRRAVAALERADAPPMARAPHVEQVAQADDDAAIQTLLDAARDAEGRAPAAAARWLQAVLRLHDDGGHAPPRLELLWQLARAQGTAGQLRESRDSLRELLMLLPPDLPAARARAVTFCARLERLLGRHADARALLLGELDRLPDQDSAERAELQLELASGSMMRGEFAANSVWARRALQGAREHGNQPVYASALAFLAMADFSAQDQARTAAVLDEAAAVVDAAPGIEVVRYLDALMWLAWSELNFERYHAAVDHLDRALTAVRGAGQAAMLPLLLSCRSDALWWLGRLPEAAACCEDAVDAALFSGSDELYTVALAAQAWIATWTGDLDLALRASDEAVAVAGPLGQWFPTLAGITRALPRLLTGDAAGCVDLIVGSAGGPGLEALDPWQRVSWFEVLVRAELARGNIAQAATWADRAEEAAAGLGLPCRSGVAMLARAQVLACSDPSAAARLALAAAAAFDRAGSPIHTGRAQLIAGATLSDPVLARAELRRAQACFAACGAPLMHRRAVREQRRLAARVPRGDRDRLGIGLSALTPRELEVAGLVREGRGNREIAQHLRVSVKTVEKHLSSIFSKIGVSSRAAVAAALAEAKAEATTELDGR
ncbi:MAG: AAA family ATPase [Streptosporangiaceae bacterium]|nr:AAA family ATPase [Streptosporangiaceae bacterium]